MYNTHNHERKETRLVRVVLWEKVVRGGREGGEGWGKVVRGGGKDSGGGRRL